MKQKTSVNIISQLFLIVLQILKTYDTEGIMPKYDVLTNLSPLISTKFGIHIIVGIINTNIPCSSIIFLFLGKTNISGLTGDRLAFCKY